MMNLTQHPATPEQLEAGVRDLPPAARERLMALLTFDAPPTDREIITRAWRIAELADGRPDRTAMIGGVPFLMSSLEAALEDVGIGTFYAFSRRESVEELQPDGSVRKVGVFRHAGFVEATTGMRASEYQDAEDGRTLEEILTPFA